MRTFINLVLSFLNLEVFQLKKIIEITITEINLSVYGILFSSKLNIKKTGTIEHHYFRYVTCHAKTRPSAHFIILRKTITNTEHERSIEFKFFIYHESTMTHLRGDTFEIFI